MSSLLLSVPPKRVLFDCGEGTANQLLRVEREGVAALAGIRWIVVSHSHADHHLGLPLLLTLLSSFVAEKPSECDEKRAKLLERGPLVIIGPPRVRVFLEMWSCFVPAIANTFTYIDIAKPTEGSRSIARLHSEEYVTEVYPDGRFGVSFPHDALAFLFVPVRKRIELRTD